MFRILKNNFETEGTMQESFLTTFKKLNTFKEQNLLEHSEQFKNRL